MVRAPLFSWAAVFLICSVAFAPPEKQFYVNYSNSSKEAAGKPEKFQMGVPGEIVADKSSPSKVVIKITVRDPGKPSLLGFGGRPAGKVDKFITVEGSQAAV